MTEKSMNVGSLEVGYKTYFYLDEICVFIEMDLDDGYEFLAINGYKDWHVTSIGDVMINSMGYSSLMINKDKDKHSNLIEEMNLILEEERITEEVLELLEKKRKVDKTLKKLSEQQDEIDKEWMDLCK
jgi:hypothetical protein